MKDNNEKQPAGKLNPMDDEMKLLKLVELYRFMVENTVDVLFQVTLAGKIRYINPSCERLAGYKPEEMIGRDWINFVPKKELPRYFSRVKDMMRGRKFDSFETYVTHKDGHLIAVDFSGRLVRIKNEVYINGIIRNITNRRQVEKTLQESEERYRQLVEFSPEAIAVHRDNKILYANPAGLKLIGAKNLDELIGKDVMDIIHPDYRATVEERMQKGYKRKKAFLVEEKFLRLDGQVVDVEVATAPVIYQGKQAVQAFIRDISDRKKVEMALKESEERYMDLYDNAPDMYFTINRDGRILSVNRLGAELLGYQKEELVNKPVTTVIHPDDIELVQQQIGEILRGKKDISKLEFRKIRKDGSVIYVNERISLYFNSQGEAMLRILCRDITERKKAEQDVIRAKEYLKNIINSASEIILSIDVNNRISTWNKTAEIVSGYKRREVIGKSVITLDIFEEGHDLEEHIKNIHECDHMSFDKLILKTKNGAKKLLQISCSVIQDSDKDIFGILLIGKDVTRDSELHGQLLKGDSYLIIDETSDSALNLFRDLTVSGYSGLFISRGNTDTVSGIHPSVDVEKVLLSQGEVKGSEYICKLDELTDRIRDFIEEKINPVILLDRIDYLIADFSFETVIKDIYELNDIITRSDAVLLVRLNPLVVSTRQLALIQEELQPLPSQKMGNNGLEDYLYDILRFIYEQNQHNTLVSYKKISRKFSISKVTTAKRLNVLGEKELIVIKKDGKTKLISISERGKKLLHKRKII